jgi:hypothetical protein
MNQPDLFSGDNLRDFGIEAAERDRNLIIREVDIAIDIYINMSTTFGTKFTAEDIRRVINANIRDWDDVSKVIGGRMRAAATRGDIYTLGETVIALRPEAHSRRMLVWYGKGNA